MNLAAIFIWGEPRVYSRPMELQLWEAKRLFGPRQLTVIDLPQRTLDGPQIALGWASDGSSAGARYPPS